MPTPLTANHARQSLTAHVAATGAEIFKKYGGAMNWPALLRLLEDRSSVRYPCAVVFDAAPLLPGELAHAQALGAHPEAGFTVFVHPFFSTQLELVPALVLYQLVLVNYGEFASFQDAETFGASALGMDREAYYQLLCEAAEQVA